MLLSKRHLDFSRLFEIVTSRKVTRAFSETTQVLPLSIVFLFFLSYRNFVKKPMKTRVKVSLEMLLLQSLPAESKQPCGNTLQVSQQITLSINHTTRGICKLPVLTIRWITERFSPGDPHASQTAFCNSGIK